MERRLGPEFLIRRKVLPGPPFPRRAFPFLVLGFLLAVPPSPVGCLELEPPPFPTAFREPFFLTLSREELPSFYWVSAGVPDAFFAPVSQVSDVPRVHALRSVRYRLTAGFWPVPDWGLRCAVPVEANALEDLAGRTRRMEGIGDLELGTTFLVSGRREEGNLLGLDGWIRFPTGPDPFRWEQPVLSPGKGVWSGAVGVLLGQQLGGFSLFQRLNYEKSAPHHLPDSPWGAGTFEWPSCFHALLRGEWTAFQRSHRKVVLFGEARVRMSGLMLFEGVAVPYGQGRRTDRVIFTSGGIQVRADREFSAEGRVDWFPFEWGEGSRPDYGLLFSLSLTWRPLSP